MLYHIHRKSSSYLVATNVNAQVFAYMWNAGARCWDKVGEVMGAPKPTQALFTLEEMGQYLLWPWA
jgi:hypothetical protein